MTDCQCQGRGVSCVFLGPGALPRERHLLSPPLSPSRPTQLTRRLTCVGCWVFSSEEVEGEAAGSRHPLGKPGSVPCRGGPESPSGAHGAGILHFSPGAVSQAFFPALSCSLSVCLTHCCGAQALGAQASVTAACRLSCGSVAPQHVGSSLTRD